MITRAKVSLSAVNDEGQVNTPVLQCNGTDDEIIQFVLANVSALPADATERYAYVTFWWRDQCNLAFGSRLISVLDERGLALWVSCVQEA